MDVVHSAIFDLRDDYNRLTGQFILEVLPEQLDRAILFDLSYESSETYQEQIQTVESNEYRYRIELVDRMQYVDQISFDKNELVTPDDKSGLTGRIRTGLYVGGVQLNIRSSSSNIGEVRFEVLSRKLDYLSHYRWMLRDISSIATDIILRYFAPSTQRFVASEYQDVANLYQQFAFLQSFVTSHEFDALITQIISSPYRSWTTESTLSLTTKGLKKSANLLKVLGKRGERIPFNNPTLPNLNSVPKKIPVSSYTEQIDNPENRFLKFVLESWREIAYNLQKILLQERRTYSVYRGIREAEEVITIINRVLSNSLFREVGNLSFIPTSSTVLQRREGYREVYRAYLQSEIAARITWEAGDDIFSLGQKDVATLYEIWVFFYMTRIVASICNHTNVDYSQLIKPKSNGLSVQIKRGRRLVLRGTAESLGRIISIDFYYNRTFKSNESSVDGSWSRDMKPDYSIKFSTKPALGTGSNEVIWIHLDAKYRIDNPTDIFGDDDFDHDQIYKRADLLVMHAYCDAVRKTEGAYIVYPGDQEAIYKRHNETLPSIGAFPLKPSEVEVAIDGNSITKFLKSIVTHLADPNTANERARYWIATSYGVKSGKKATDANVLSLLDTPPADTQIIILNLNEISHFKWILDQRRIIFPLHDGNVMPIRMLRCSLVVIKSINTSAWLCKIGNEMTVYDKSSSDGDSDESYIDLEIGISINLHPVILIEIVTKFRDYDDLLSDGLEIDGIVMSQILQLSEVL